MEGNRITLIVPGLSSCKLKGLFGCFYNFIDPALLQSSPNSRSINLGNNPHTAGYFYRLSLGSAHPSEARGNKEMSAKITVVWNSQLQPSGVENRVERTVDYPLGSNVHPPACSHLSIIGYSQSLSLDPLLLVIEHSHHKRIGDNDPRA